MSCGIEILKHTHTRTHIYSHSHNIKKSSWSSAHNNHLGLFSLLLLLLLLLSNARHKAVKFFFAKGETKERRQGERSKRHRGKHKSSWIRKSENLLLYIWDSFSKHHTTQAHTHSACMHACTTTHAWLCCFHYSFSISSSSSCLSGLPGLLISSLPYPTPQGTVTYAKTTTTAHHHPPSHRTVNSTKKCLNVGIVGLLSKSCYPTYDDYYYYYCKKRQEKRRDVL